MNSNNNICPCGSDLSYSACCEPFHQGQRNAQTAEQLMRSRFSAFALCKTDYVLKTWCEKKRPKRLDLSQQPTWTRLEVHRTEQGLSDDKQGKVMFSAYYKLDALTEGVMHETSRFRRDRHQQWCYLDGVVS